MRLTLVAVLALGPQRSRKRHSPTGSYGNVLHPGVPSPGALRPPAPLTRPGSVGRLGNGGPASRWRTAGVCPGYSEVYAVRIRRYGFDSFYQGDYAPESPCADPNPPRPPSSSTRISRPTVVHPQFRDYSNIRCPSPAP